MVVVRAGAEAPMENLKCSCIPSKFSGYKRGRTKYYTCGVELQSKSRKNETSDSCPYGTCETTTTKQYMVGWWAQRAACEKREHYIVDVRCEASFFLVKLKEKMKRNGKTKYSA